MTTPQIVQTVASIIGILVVIAAPLIYVIRLHGQIILINRLFEGLEKKVDKIDLAVTNVYETMLRAATPPAVSQPRRAGRGRDKVR